MSWFTQAAARSRWVGGDRVRGFIELHILKKSTVYSYIKTIFRQKKVIIIKKKVICRFYTSRGVFRDLINAQRRSLKMEYGHV